MRSPSAMAVIRREWRESARAIRMPRVPGCPYVRSHTWLMGRSAVAKPLSPWSAQNLLLDCRNTFESERYGSCSIALCFSSEKDGATSMSFWTEKGTAQTMKSPPTV